MSTPGTITRRGFLAAAAAAAAASMVDLKSSAEAATLPPALFVAAHPDDETLATGVVIADHVAAGQEVHVLWLTRGAASGVRNVLNGSGVNAWWGVQHNPGAEGYSPLGTSAFGQARIGEATRAVLCLSAGLAGSLTLHEARLQDREVTVTAAEEAIVAAADAIAPGGPVRVKTHTHIVDDQPDHLAAGQAARSLKSSDPSRFGDLRHYVLPAYWADSRLSQVTEAWDRPNSTEIRHRAVNAYRSYGAWHPPSSFAVGYHSTSAMFSMLLRDPKSMVHP